MKFIDLTGNRYGRLLVVSKSHKDKRGLFHWNCVCDCGNFHTVARNALQSGSTKSCGCLNQEMRILNNTTHGMSKTKVYSVWSEMINRTTNQNHQHSQYYFDRGITVDENWRTFENFYNDMGSPQKGQWLERVDNTKGYCKENCAWTSISEQCLNRRSLVNKSGRVGVYWDAERGKWRTSMQVKGVQVAGRAFNVFEDACEYIDQLELEHLGYSRKDGFTQ